MSHSPFSLAELSLALLPFQATSHYHNRTKPHVERNKVNIVNIMSTTTTTTTTTATLLKRLKREKSVLKKAGIVQL